MLIAANRTKFQRYAVKFVVYVVLVVASLKIAQAEEWKPHSCLVRSAVDCSTRGWDRLVPVAHYNNTFKDSCVQHDFCYRFGKNTYGYTRKQCDTRMLSQMREACSDPGIEWLLTAGLSAGACFAAAEGYYSAVRSSAGKKSWDEGSRFCEYEGPRANCHNSSLNKSCWTNAFSEESGGHMSCGAGRAIAGLWCAGRYCDDKRLYCKPYSTSPKKPVFAGRTKTISEEKPNTEIKLSGRSARLMESLDCDGSYCDNISATITRVGNLTATNSGKWTPYFSEEDGTAISTGNGQQCTGKNEYVTGIRCKGRYCDNLSLRCTSFKKASFSGSSNQGIISKNISLSTDNSKFRKSGDAEINSDDWTWTKISYSIQGKGTKKALIQIVYKAYEGNRNKSFGDTRFTLTKSIPLGSFDKHIKAFSTGISGSKEVWFRGRKHGYQNFPDFGPFKNLEVSFDRKGRSDHKALKLRGLVKLSAQI